MAQPPFVQPVKGQNVVLAERAEAQKWRDRDKGLASFPTDQPLVVDLSNVRIITYSAADELLRKWLVLARNESRAGEVVVAFYSPRSVVQETIHAVLKAHSLAAYALTRSKNPSEDEPQPIGEVTRVNQETLDVLRGAYPQPVAASFIASELGLADTAAISRLQELADKGLIVREGRSQGSRGRPSTLYRYPYASKSAQTRLIRPRVRPMAPQPR